MDALSALRRTAMRVSVRRSSESALAAETQRLMVTLKAIGDGVVTVLPNGFVDFVNAAAQRMLGVTFADAYGSPLRSVVRLVDERGESREVPLDAAGDARGEGRLGEGDGQRHIAFVSSPIVATSGATIGYVVVLRDVTAQARLTRRLAYEASHDSLTRLPNRRHFEEMVGIAIDAARARGTSHTVVYIDLDYFKRVNDTMGHRIGDELLRDVAARMSRNVRGNDVLARIGGDEFALLLHECTTEDAMRVADTIRESIETASRELVGDRAFVGASVGIASLDGDTHDAAAVLDEADRACYAAKAGGRNAVVAAASIVKGSS